MSVSPLRPAVGGLLACVAVLAVSVLAGSASVRALAGGGCAGADTPHVGLVIDFGTVTSVAGAPTPQVQTACVPLSAGAYGDTVLHAAGVSIRYGPGGLICALDGYPASGCGTDTANGYQYWSYWHGGSGWTYSNVGASSYRPPAGGVEGWHFVQGQDSAAEGPPGFSASGPCPGATPTTAAPGPSPTTAHAPTATTELGHPAAASSATSSSLASAGSGSGSAPGSSSTTAATTATTSAASGEAASHRSQALPSHGEIVARSGRGSPVGPILVALVIVGLVVVSVLIRRRRNAT